MIDWFTPQVTAQEEAAIVAFMRHLAAAPVARSRELQGHDALWWKAQLLRRWDQQRKAAAPLNAMEPVQMIVSLVAAALVLIWALPSLMRALALFPG